MSGRASVVATRPSPLWRVGEVLLRLLTAAGLAVDAYVHADLAKTYDAVGSHLTQGTLFRIEAGVSSFAALVVIVTGARLAYGFAFLVAASAFGAILLYRYKNVGSLGPLPQMYEPAWFPEKKNAAIAEGVATVTALAGFLLPRAGRRTRRLRRAETAGNPQPGSR